MSGTPARVSRASGESLGGPPGEPAGVAPGELAGGVLGDSSARPDVAALTAALQASERALAEARAAHDVLLYRLSHDFRAPVRAISALADWVAEDALAAGPDATGKSDISEHLQLLRSRAGRLDLMMAGLVALDAAGRPASPDALADTGASARSGVSRVQGLRLEVALSAMPELHTDHMALTGIFAALVDNANRHAGASATHVKLWSRDANGCVEFVVEDDGVGVPEADRSRVLEPFVTLRARDDVEVAGLGLACVCRAVATRGGTINVGVGEQGGTRVTFTLGPSR